VVDRGNSAICSPVAGLNTGARRELELTRRWPPTAFSMICITRSSQQMERLFHY
jgi:hypothetical protein